MVGSSARVKLLLAKFSVPNALSTPVIVVEPVTASAVVVAPFAVSPPLKAISEVVAELMNGYANESLVLKVVQSALEKFMARDIIRTPNAPSPPPMYSQAVRAAGLVFVSGTGPHDPVTGKIVGDTIQEQTRQCLENVSAILKAAGTSLDRVVSATVILLEETDFVGMNEEWMKWFPVNPPARQGAKLPVRIPGLRVSIAAIAEA